MKAYSNRSVQLHRRLRSVVLPSALLIFLFTGSFALAAAKSAQDEQEKQDRTVHTCSLDFTVKGTDIQILIGYSRLKGIGEVACVDADGRASRLPVKVKLGTPVLFPRISFAPSLVVRGTAENVKVFGGPKAFLGKYLTLDIRFAIGGGAAAILALESEDGSTVIQLKLNDVEGFGLAAGGTEVTIE